MSVVKLPSVMASIDAIQRALYRVAAISTWDITKVDDSWHVELTPNDGVSIKEIESLFKQHVIDYSLREKIRSETEQVRALLLAHAFSGVNRQ